MMLSPLANAVNKAMQCHAILANFILHLRRNLLINDAMDDAVFFKIPQLLGQHLLRNIRDATAQLARSFFAG
ncbi:hypothetical protein D3C74_02210 [compost metagenome]